MDCYCQGDLTISVYFIGRCVSPSQNFLVVGHTAARRSITAAVRRRCNFTTVEGSAAAVWL